jgi:sec-independent protein translocase protein TatB
MFDMGFTEMMLIGIVALVVIGPERLPGVARTAGKYFSRLRNFMMNVRADVESELKADELREILKKQQEELSSLKDVVNDVGKGLSEDIGTAEIKKSIEGAMPDLNDSLDPEPIAETRPAPKTSVKASSKKNPTSKKKSSLKTKTASKTKAAPKKPKASPKVLAKETVAPKKAKATSKAKSAPMKTATSPRASTKTRVKPKTVAKLKPKSGDSSVVSPVVPGDTDQG